MRVLNAHCTDIRKSTVARHFRDVFGYSLEVDPYTYTGAMVCKSEKNGVHDGRVVQGPLTETEEGYLYQRFVSYPTPTGNAEWRLFIVGQKPVAVYRACAPVNKRFAFGKDPEMTTVEESFSVEERAKITEFCRRIGLDFGNLDVLREQTDGRMYISDCNNTVTGPSSKLRVRDQLRVVNAIGAAFRREYLKPVTVSQRQAREFSTFEA